MYNYTLLQTQNKTNSPIFINSGNIILIKFLAIAHEAILAHFGSLTHADEQALCLCISALRDNITQFNPNFTIPNAEVSIHE